MVSRISTFSGKYEHVNIVLRWGQTGTSSGSTVTPRLRYSCLKIPPSLASYVTSCNLLNLSRLPFPHL